MFRFIQNLTFVLNFKEVHPKAVNALQDLKGKPHGGSRVNGSVQKSQIMPQFFMFCFQGVRLLA